MKLLNLKSFLFSVFRTDALTRHQDNFEHQQHALDENLWRPLITTSFVRVRIDLGEAASP